MTLRQADSSAAAKLGDKCLMTSAMKSNNTKATKLRTIAKVVRSAVALVIWRHLAAQRFDRSAFFFGFQSPFLRPKRRPRCDPFFGNECRLFDHLGQAFACYVSVACLAAGFVALNDDCTFIRPFSTRYPFEARFDRCWQVGRPLRFKPQFDCRRDLVHILTARSAGSDKCFGQFPVFQCDGVIYAEHEWEDANLFGNGKGFLAERLPKATMSGAAIWKQGVADVTLAPKKRAAENAALPKILWRESVRSPIR